MSRSKVLPFAAALLLAAVAPVRAQTKEPLVSLKVGPAVLPGLVSFTIGLTETGESLEVEAFIDLPMSAAEKAEQVALAVAAADPSEGWRALADGGGLTFQRLVGETWKNVDSVSSFLDTTGAGIRLKTVERAAAYKLKFAPDSVASGVDAQGRPSFITVSLTDTLTWTMALDAGQTAADVLDSFTAFLAEEAGEGVEVFRDSESTVVLQLRYEVSHLNWQITDTGLEAKLKGTGSRIEINAMLIRR
jgi:hypothetical protein